MDGNSGGSLEKILQTVEDLEQQVLALGSRLDALEKVGEQEMSDAPASKFQSQEKPVETKPPPLFLKPKERPYTPIPAIEPPFLSEKIKDDAAAFSAPNIARPSGGIDDILHGTHGTSSRQPSPTPSYAQKPAKAKESWEVHIAGTWLPRIGVLFLALALILLARQHVQGPVGKVVGCYILSAVLTGLGLWKGRKYPLWAAPVLAGGLAFSYFTSYAMGFVEPMRLLESLSLKLAILAVNLAVVFGFAQWKKSEVIAGTALMLGFLTTGVVGNDLAALCSTLALSIVALLFLWLNNWFISTALAAGATYLAYLYIWKAVPEAVPRSDAEAFWFHFLFLSLVFVVYTAAGFIGKQPAMEEMTKNPPPSDASEKLTSGKRLNLLTVLTQTNVAAYIGGMIIALRVTYVYWDQAWLFFFPMAVACAALAAAFAGLRNVQVTYLTAAAACFTFGVMSAASPLWLPVFLTLQAVVMLMGARNRRHTGLWYGLSLLVLLYAGGYLLTGGQFGRWDLTNDPVLTFPLWTFASATALTLLYAGTWEKLAPGKLQNVAVEKIIPYLVAAGAVVTWRCALDFFDLREALFIAFGLAVPAVTLATVLVRTKAPVLFVGLTAMVCFAGPGYLHFFDDTSPAPNLLMIQLGLAGLGAAWLAERLRFNDGSVFRLLWGTVYVWAQLILAAGLAWSSRDWPQTFLYVCVFAVCAAAGWLARSAALAKSGFVAVFFVLFYAIGTRQASTWWPVGCVLLLLATAYPIATPLWRRRTGDRWSAGNQWGQAAVVSVAGIVFLRGVALQDFNLTFASGGWALVCALYAATGRFRPVASVAVVYAGLLALFICLRLLFADLLNYTQMSRGAEVCWSIAGVLLVVTAERVLKFAPKLAWPWSDSESWLTPGVMTRVTNILAIGTLITAVLALRILPDLRVFYFTGAMVGAAFIWIVFGFLFNEPVYRKSGFILLCAGIVKGLIWDVLSLKNTVYRQISWAVLGLLALAASFLYSKFRGRVE